MLINLIPIARRAPLFPILVILIAGCASTGEQRNTASPASSGATLYPRLANRIDHLLADTLFPPSNAGIMIYSLTNREALYSRNAELLFAPGSNQKLVTAAAAFELLDREYTFATEVFVDSSLAEPQIVIRGSGDPLIDTDDIDSIAGAIAGIVRRTIPWNLVADISLFDGATKGKGWMWDDDPYEAPISPLSANGNSIEIVVEPGQGEGDPARATMREPTEFVLLENLVTTSQRGKKDSLVVERSADDAGDRFQISGSIALDKKSSTTMVGVSSPEAYWLSLFSRSLADRGIVVGSWQFGTADNNADPSFTYERNIDSVLYEMMKESDNLCAENVFRILGISVTGEAGSNEDGILAVETALARLGIDTAKLVTADGSGVSRYNLLSATTLVRILEVLYDRQPDFDRLFATLPIAGVDGTLSTRMKGTPAQGNLRGKTGTLRGASSLAGYVTTADGEFLAFSILMQNYPTGPKNYRAAQDSIGVLLSRSRRNDFR